MLGNAVVCNDSKPEFPLSFATWIEQWSTCPKFSLTKQTSRTLITTPKVTFCLLSELLNEGISTFSLIISKVTLFSDNLVNMGR